MSMRKGVVITDDSKKTGGLARDLARGPKGRQWAVGMNVCQV